jgi:energy-coupling factor transport system substrate-specific component
MREKLTIKDLITIGIFTAMYIFVMMIIVTLLGTVPVLYIIAPFFVGIGCATVYTLLVMRVPKKGAVLILSIMLSILFMSTNWMATIFAVICGLIAEIILSVFGRKNKTGIVMSFIAMSCATMGPYFGIIFMKENFIESVVPYYGQEYADKLAALTPPWIVLPLVVVTIFGAVLGMVFARKLLKKHFKKAGIV